ncbi:hypothetical protein K0U07_02530 [bacterium]|nr:hypothetical protein [bacterium]
MSVREIKSPVPITLSSKKFFEVVKDPKVITIAMAVFALIAFVAHRFFLRASDSQQGSQSQNYPLQSQNYPPQAIVIKEQDRASDEVAGSSSEESREGSASDEAAGSSSEESGEGSASDEAAGSSSEESGEDSALGGGGGSALEGGEGSALNDPNAVLLNEQERSTAVESTDLGGVAPSSAIERVSFTPEEKRIWRAQLEALFNYAKDEAMLNKFVSLRLERVLPQDMGEPQFYLTVNDVVNDSGLDAYHLEETLFADQRIANSEKSFFLVATIANPQILLVAGDQCRAANLGDFVKTHSAKTEELINNILEMVQKHSAYPQFDSGFRLRTVDNTPSWFHLIMEPADTSSRGFNRGAENLKLVVPDGIFRADGAKMVVRDVDVLTSTLISSVLRAPICRIEYLKIKPALTMFDQDRGALQEKLMHLMPTIQANNGNGIFSRIQCNGYTFGAPQDWEVAIINESVGNVRANVGNRFEDEYALLGDEDLFPMDCNGAESWYLIGSKSLGASNIGNVLMPRDGDADETASQRFEQLVEAILDGMRLRIATSVRGTSLGRSDFTDGPIFLSTSRGKGNGASESLRVFITPNRMYSERSTNYVEPDRIRDRYQEQFFPAGDSGAGGGGGGGSAEE